MEKLLSLTLLLFAIGTFAQDLDYIQGEILVKFEKNYQAENLESDSPQINITESKLISRVMNIWKLSIDVSNINEMEAIRELYSNRNVVIAQLNHKVTVRATIPDDPLFSNQWQYFQANDKDIDADEAWDVTTGGTTPNGDVIVAGVVDNGFNIAHPDLVENLYINEAEIPGNNIDDDNNGYIDDVNGWSAYTSSGTINSAGHGTSVFGIIGAKGNNGIGVTGVNWDVKVMPISGSSGDESVVLEAYSYILESRMLYNSSGGTEGAFVVATNASFGIDFGQPEDSPLWCAMYDTLGQNGILNCGATINANENVDIIGDVPTACPSEYMIAVTNMDITDTKVTSAGYGLETIDLGAHGAGTFTTSQTSYGGFGGTSGATPHVTGTIALLYSAPCQNLADLAMSNPEFAAQIVRDLILENVDPNASLVGITVTEGRLNVNNSIQALMAMCESLSVSDNNIEKNNVILSPNPATNFISISSKDNDVLASVSIYSLTGRLIKNSEPTTNDIDVSSLSSGTYMIKVQFENDLSPYFKLFVKE
jgi:subtilisin family serine protease